MAIMTMNGLYNYDNALFDNMDLPEGIDKDLLISNIMLESGEFCVMYPNADYMKYAIGIWSNKWNRTFTKWVEALSIEYSPLENYDRKEDWTDTNEGTIKNEGDIKHTGTVKDTGTMTSEHQVSAFDSSAYQPKDKTVDTPNTTQTNDLKDSTDLTQTNDLTNTHDGRIHGNIGVTTSQAMLQSELDISLLNFINHITDLFIEEFCIMVY